MDDVKGLCERLAGYKGTLDSATYARWDTFTVSVSERVIVALLDDADEAATALTAAQARIRELEAEVARVQSDREYVIGFNAGWDEAAEQTLLFPTMLRKMWSGDEVQKWIDQQMDELRARSTKEPT